MTPALTPGLTRRLYWAAIALACSSVALAAGGLALRLAAPTGAAPDAPASGFLADATAVSIDPILAFTPFGRVAPPAAPAAAADDGALGLTLHGVVIAADPGASTAIVSGAGPTGAFAPGQAIGAATLVEVHPGHVVLDTPDGPVTLAFPAVRGEATSAAGGAVDGADPVGDDLLDDDDYGGGGLDALRALALDQAGGAAEPEVPDAPAPASDPQAEAAPLSDLAAAVAAYRDRLLDDPQALIDDLGLVAGADGYRVDAGAAAEVLRAGLRPGDVVTKVNGQQVGNIEADRRFFDEVAVSDRARLEVARNGQSILMSFPLR